MAADHYINLIFAPEVALHFPALSCSTTSTPQPRAVLLICEGGNMKNTLVKASAITQLGANTVTEDQYRGESPEWGFKI